MSINIKTENGLVKVAGKVNSFPVNKISSSDYLEDSPIGTIISFMGTTAPAHYLACDGAVYNITAYPDLAEFIKNEFGSYNYFGGDGTTTFGVPNLNNGRFLKGSSTPGINEQAGIPNITGSTAGIFAWTNGSAVKSGAVTTSAKTNDAYINQDGQDSSTTSHFRNTKFQINASDSNAIYGKSSTVTPLNTSVLYCIKYESTYFMEVEDVGYSTSETFTGKTWIDGKPIYRRVIDVSELSITPTQLDTRYRSMYNTSFSDTNKIISMIGSIVYSDNTNTVTSILGHTYMGNNNSIQRCSSMLYLNDTLYIYYDSSYSADRLKEVHVIIEYTKTTD